MYFYRRMIKLSWIINVKCIKEKPIITGALRKRRLDIMILAYFNILNPGKRCGGWQDKPRLQSIIVDIGRKIYMCIDKRKKEEQLWEEYILNFPTDQNSVWRRRNGKQVFWTICFPEMSSRFIVLPLYAFSFLLWENLFSNFVLMFLYFQSLL